MGNDSKHIKIYRQAFGISWDGEFYDIHHINGNHHDNSVKNLILLPKNLHRRLHSILRQNPFNFDDTVEDITNAAYMAANNGAYTDCRDWFMMYSQIAIDLSFWARMKQASYRGQSGKILPFNDRISEI